MVRGLAIDPAESVVSFVTNGTFFAHGMVRGGGLVVFFFCIFLVFAKAKIRKNSFAEPAHF